jgi:GNAT superfamily N-acetyltransferase
MARISLLQATELAELACPYCGRTVSGQLEWAEAAHRRWGRCGVKLVHDGEVVGVLALGPAERRGEATVKVLWVRPEVAGRGYGRQLVQAATAEMVRLKLDALVAVGGLGRYRCACPPVPFLERVGFRRVPDSPLWRLELHQAVLERSGLGAIGRFLRGFGAGPQPAGGTVSGRNR